MVTIPKSRLEELERKEAELAKLKGEVVKTHEQNVKLQQQHEADVAKIASTPAPTAPVPPAHVSPPMASLPPLNPGEAVNAMDLAGHYKAEPTAADARYKKKSFVIRGEILGFDKPMLRSDYKILLNSGNREMDVVCEMLTPEQYSAVFTTKNGSEMVGTLADTSRVTLAKRGQAVSIIGKCKGVKGNTVIITDCHLLP
jgi:hypothetical protein